MYYTRRKIEHTDGDVGDDDGEEMSLELGAIGEHGQGEGDDSGIEDGYLRGEKISLLNSRTQEV
jgi:hypothetical protein